jgi:hypothetical protein
MNNDVLQEIIKKQAPGPSFDEQVIQVFEYVRDIPYGSIDSRDPNDVYTHYMGTCSGKHALLTELFRFLGFEVRIFLAKHNIKDLSLNLPEDYSKFLETRDIVGYHNFIKIKRGDKWITVDATFDSEIEVLGFPVTHDWGGYTDMPIVVKYTKIHEVEDPAVEKKKLLKDLPQKEREDRKQSHHYLNNWIRDYRKSLLEN